MICDFDWWYESTTMYNDPFDYQELNTFIKIKLQNLMTKPTIIASYSLNMLALYYT